jgi:hypothetical protein
LLASVSLLIPVPSNAADERRQQIGPWVWGIDGGAVHQFDTDLSGTNGSFGVDRYFIQPSIAYAWDRRNSVSLAIGFGDSDYQFSSGATIDGQQPWSRINDYRISVPIRFSPSERTDAIIVPSVRIDAESGASLNDGRTEGLLAGIGWRVSDTLFIGPGFGWFSELGGGSDVFPIIVIDWAITNKLSLTTGRGLAASQGPGLTLEYDLDDKWKLGLAGRYEKIRFALDNDAAAAARYGEDRSLPLVLSVQYTLWPMTTVGAFMGAEFQGKLSVEDSGGDTIASSEYDTAGLIGLVFRSRF